MYCPKCGNQNSDDGKFCRSCGGDLEAVALAVNNRIAPPSSWMEKYGEGKSGVITGSVLAGASILIWLIPALMIKDVVAWVAIWSVFFGWMAIWGAIMVANSLGGMLQAKTMLQAENARNAELPGGDRPGLIHATPNLQLPDGGYTTGKLQQPVSVTENTTKLLAKD